jgi:hypothetical protein
MERKNQMNNWDKLTIDERLSILEEVYCSALSKINGYQYLPIPSQVCYCTWNNLPQLYIEEIINKNVGIVS